MRRVICLVSLFVVAVYSYAQVDDNVYRSETEIDTARYGELRVELDNISFFKDNEYSGGFQKGYTLPGFWIQPKLVYYPLKNVKLELGAHLLRYWGASRYPCYAYHDIENWSGEQYSKGFHALPWFRAQMAFNEKLSIVLGDIYGAANHGLLDPLYNSEMNLMADPEAGVQVLYNSSRFDLDAWVNWQSFIFREDTHQEAFIVGLSSKIKLSQDSNQWHIYVPVQLLAQHRGGEIDTIYTNSVQTLMNGAVGIGLVRNTDGRYLKRVGAELDFAFSYQQAGDLWPFDSGFGGYMKLFADIRNLRAKVSYWQCKQFVSLLGNPFYNAISLQDVGTVFYSPKTLYAGLEYTYPLGNAFAFGVDVDVYYHLKCNKSTTEGVDATKPAATSFSVGVYLRVNPSVLLKNFRK